MNRQNDILDFKLDYPREYGENLRYRTLLLQKSENDIQLQVLLKEKCKRDVIFWCDLFAWTKDPRKKPDTLPFILYESCQINFVREVKSAILNGTDLGIDKTRDMGASWGILMCFLHSWMFEDGADFRVGSRKEEFVDKLGDIDTLFEKLRFCLEKQPVWLMPKGFEWGKHSSYMRLINPENGNAIIGESANANFGSGGRRKAVLLDEFSKWDDSVARAAWTSTADVTPCRIVVSTPLGAGNKFAELMQGIAEKIKRISLHWTLHPEKAKDSYFITPEGQKIPIKGLEDTYSMWRANRNKVAPGGIKGGIVRSPWYDAECERRSSADIAQELDINYLASGRPFFDLGSLDKQKRWTYITRVRPVDPIPWGNFIRATLVEQSHKIVIMERPDGWLRIFEMPRREYQYVVGADTSEGLVKGDKSACVVREKWTRNVVATSNELTKPEEFAFKLWLLGKLYNDAELAPENNNHGYTVCKDLEGMGCQLFYSMRDEVSQGTIVETTKRGFTTTPRTRPLILDQMSAEITNVACELRDEELIQECYTFVHEEKKGKPEADGNFLDDMVLAFAICGEVIRLKPYKANPSKYNYAKDYVNRSKTRKNAGFSFAKS